MCLARTVHLLRRFKSAIMVIFAKILGVFESLASFIILPVSDLFIKKLYLKDMVKHVRGKRILICCSAPTADFSTVKWDLSVGVSGGYFLLKDASVNVDYALFDASLFDSRYVSKNLSKVLLTEKIKAYNLIEKLILVHSNNAVPYLEQFNSSNRPVGIRSIPKWMRRYIVNIACGTKHLDNFGVSVRSQVGTGAWGAILFAYLGASQIHVTGINLRTGTDSREYTQYAYSSVEGVNKANQYTDSAIRNHAGPDCAAFANVATRLNKRCIFSTNEPEIAPLLSRNLT